MNFNKKLDVLFEDLDTGYQEIDVNQVNSILKSEASKYKPQQKIYTFLSEDVSEGRDFILTNPTEMERDYTNQYHALIMDSLDTWREFPNRGNAVVATADKEMQVEGKDTYLVIPLNGNILGVCSKPSIFKSFPHVSINLGLNFKFFDGSLNIVLNIFNNAKGTFDETSKKLTKHNLETYFENYDTFKAAIDKVDEYIFTDEGNSLINEIVENPFNKETEQNVVSILEYLRAKEINLVSMINNLFDPFENAFQMISFENFVIGDNKNREVWLDGKCILVKETATDQLMLPGTSGELKGASDEESGDTDGSEETPDEEPTEEPQEDEEISDETPEETPEQEPQEEPAEQEEPQEDEEEDDEELK